jgi:hypothetical protein
MKAVFCRGRKRTNTIVISGWVGPDGDDEMMGDDAVMAGQDPNT